MKNKINVTIIDDGIPVREDFVEASIYNSLIPKDILIKLITDLNWKGHHNLKKLTKTILESKECDSGVISISAFTHPAICLDAIEKGFQPDIIIYDWEYSGESNIKSSDWLLELLTNSDSTVFVYSQVRDSIPPFLNKSIFDNHSKRFQLFLKGDEDNSVFSSEEFILQYILSRVSRSTEILIGGTKIQFVENGFISNPSDILFIENILGRQNLIQKLQQIESLSNESIINLFNGLKLEFYFDEAKKYLIDSSATALIEKYSSSKKMTALEVLQTFGLITLSKAIESGITKV
ncbi:MAG: hypothetical protein WAT43_15245 [Chitinophagales bacterium]